MFANPGTVKNYRSSTDQTLISYSTSMHNRAVRNSDSVTDYSRISNVTMNNNIVLDATVSSDSNVAIVSSQN